ncbi:MAG TPA: efflux RND transporter periplasmic adaptor subunit [Steroidobacter sp.]|uniref:HlyD family secretion protein n=1 Tax=Steroidobacter sp. TaxID=1978227 RepID=UPI002ED893B1
MNQDRKKKTIAIAIVAAVGAIAWILWRTLQPEGFGDAFVSGNGRIEATEINVAAKLGGRVEDIFVREGDFVKAHQPLAKMQVVTLEAQRDEARAIHQQAITSVATAKAQLAMRRSEVAAAQAAVIEAESALDAAERRLNRSEMLAKEGASSGQELDDDRARARAARAALEAAKARVVAAESAVEAARTQIVGAESSVIAAAATVARIEADIEDSVLSSPRDGRVQYRIAQPGEVLAAGSPVLNLVDLSDVYMTFFLPETVVGRVALGSEVRIILDAAPEFVIPAKVSFVADTAQFTPKTVETANERQKLMFRVRAHIDRDLLQKHLTQVKTGLPGVAWLKLDRETPWPESLAINTPE